MPKAGRNLTLGSLLFVFVFAVSAVALYGGAQLVDSDAPAAAADGENGDVVPGGPVAVTITARNLLFDRRTITASSGAQVTVTLNNEDAGVIHNIAFYTNRSASQSIAVGPLITGPATDILTFTAPSAPGNNFFRCDVHPDTMTGSLSVR